MDRELIDIQTLMKEWRKDGQYVRNETVSWFKRFVNS